MTAHKGPVIVLHRYSYKESSQILRVYSRELGSLSLLAKGVRRQKNAFGNALDPLCHSELVLDINPSRDLQYPREAMLLNYWNNLRRDLSSLSQAQFIAEIVLRMIHGEGHHNQVYELLLESLGALESGQRLQVAPFLLEISAELGFAMQMHNCVRCSSVLLNLPAELLPQEGGALCINCQGPSSARYSQSLRIHLAEFVGQGKQPEQGEFQRNLEAYLLQYLQLHLGIHPNLRSLEWMWQARSLGNSTSESSLIKPNNF